MGVEAVHWRQRLCSSARPTMTLTQPFLIKDCRFTFLAQNLARTVIMKSIVAAIFLILLVSVTNAFTVAPRAGVVSKAPSTTSLNMVFGNKKSSAQKAADKEKESKYWQGEWVCKDCGYIYNRVSASFVVDSCLFLSENLFARRSSVLESWSSLPFDSF